jgi:hypothetical protein
MRISFSSNIVAAVVIANDACIVDDGNSFEYDFTGDTSTNQITVTGMKFTTTYCSGTSDTSSEVYSQNTCIEEEVDDDFSTDDDGDDFFTDDDDFFTDDDARKVSKNSAVQPMSTLSYGTYVGYSSEPSVSYSSIILT